ncbi:MAG: ribonuclease III [Clostridiales bacterium]|nr:ribonuclease III [Clostridiales bacterium]
MEPKITNELEKKIGYSFKNRSLLTEALTHSSYSNEKRSKGADIECNERLEFLGDSVLSIAVSRYLFEKYKDRQEGDLTKIRASVVCEKALSKFAAKIELGKYIRLGHGEELNNGRERASILADAFEALLAAMYIDSGHKLEHIDAFLMPHIISEIDSIGVSGNLLDYKTALQQIVQQVEGEKLEYVLVGESGPDHNKIFEIEARLNSNVIGKGRAHSKREAEQMAAHEALSLFGEEK